MTSSLRAICASALATCLLLACGAKMGTVGDSVEADARAPQPDARAPQPDARALQPDARAPQPDAGLCVSIDPSSYDVACNVATDCVTVGSGTICTGDCALCRGQYGVLHDGVATMAISAAALAKYNADTAVLESACEVVEATMCTGFAAACLDHRCAAGQGG